MDRIYVYVREDRVDLELRSDDYIDCSLKQLLAMATFFGTTNIEDYRWEESQGCITCGYGESQVIEFTIRPEDNL